MAYFNNKRILMTCVYEGSGTTLKNLLNTTQRAAYLFSGYTGTNVDGLIAYSDTENVTTMNSMFYSCRNLTSVPLLDTSSVIFMSIMFQECPALTSVPAYDTSNVTSMQAMFNGCSSLTTIPLFNTGKVTVTQNMFKNCSALVSVPALDMSKISSATNMANMFSGCSNLEEIHMTGMKVNFDISASTKFTASALVEILNNLATVSSTQTLTMGATNLAKLTAEEKAIATNKGWTLA